MISPGQRITVLASSNNKPGAHIRRGSTGYISTNHRSVVIKKLNVVLMATEIIFNRFGFEEKYRCERKTVVALYPLINITEIKDHQAYLDKLTKKALDFIGVIKLHLSIVTKKVDIVVITTRPCSMSNNINEFKPWFLSILCRNEVYDFLTNNTDTPFKKAIKNIPIKGLNDLLIGAILDKKTSLELADNVFNTNKSIGVYDPVIKFLKIKICLENRLIVSNVNFQFVCKDERYSSYSLMWFLKSSRLPLQKGKTGVPEVNTLINNIIYNKNDNMGRWIDALNRL